MIKLYLVQTSGGQEARVSVTADSRGSEAWGRDMRGSDRNKREQDRDPAKNDRQGRNQNPSRVSRDAGRDPRGQRCRPDARLV